MIAAAPVPVAPPGWVEIDRGPAGGTTWQGRIPGDPARAAISTIYLPPSAAPDGRYPLLVVLHGFPGGAWSIALGLRFARSADAAIEARSAPPFVAVMPGAARHAGEWAGRWERWLVGRALRWARRALPISSAGAERALAGLSAGGYGAVDIGLRHPRLFGTLEAWSGYFHPFRDGALEHAPPRVLADHDPTLLLGEESSLLRRLGTRVYLSCGTRDPATLRDTLAFARDLGREGVPHELWLGPGGHNGRFWRAQLGAPLAYAFPDRSLAARGRGPATPLR
jgi:enterochelin esterase-like enzyme